ncbi:MAG: hypothetical protein IBX44_06010 [Sulfurospirillum sp.]|nr:hypothetical protein [Sulfurospirillum sp.]
MFLYKQISDLAIKRNLVLVKLQVFDKKKLGTRKKLTVFIGLDTKDFYHTFFIFEQKSRFVLQHAHELSQLQVTLDELRKRRSRFKHLCLCCAVCQKAKVFLENEGWRIHDDFM